MFGEEAAALQHSLDIGISWISWD